MEVKWDTQKGNNNENKLLKKERAKLINITSWADYRTTANSMFRNRLNVHVPQNTYQFRLFL